MNTTLANNSTTQSQGNTTNNPTSEEGIDQNQHSQENTSNLPVDYFDKIIDIVKNKKDLLAIFITVIGIIISIMFFLYQKGYYSYFNIDYNGNEMDNKIWVYHLIYGIGSAAAILLPNLIALIPLEINCKQRWLYELIWGIVSLGLVFRILNGPLEEPYNEIIITLLLIFVADIFPTTVLIDCKDNTDRSMLKVVWKVFCILFSMASIVFLLLINKSILIVSIMVWGLVFELFILIILLDKLTTPKNSISSTNVHNSSNGDVPAETRIKNKNKALRVLCFLIILVFFIFGFISYQSGKDKAENKTIFKIIDYDISSGEDIIPVNIVILENDDTYLIEYGSLKHDDNYKTLYLQKNKQKVIEKADVLLTLVEFDNVK